MSTLTLLTKINHSSQLNQVRKAVETLLSGLEVEIKILGSVANGWVQIAFSGEDEGIAVNYVIQEVGLCPSSFENVEEFSTLKGYIQKIGKNELTVDVGIFQPEIVYANLPLRHLQDELVDGRKIATSKIAKLFGFCEGVPVNVKVNGLKESKNFIDVKLSREQIRKYIVWQESLLDRLLVLGPSLLEVEATIEQGRIDRDVINVERLGLFEHSLKCKLGTDATGLIPKIGRKLKNARFAVFNPKKLRHFLSI
jgi:hypothetical protein